MKKMEKNKRRKEGATNLQKKMHPKKHVVVPIVYALPSQSRDEEKNGD